MENGFSNSDNDLEDENITLYYDYEEDEESPFHEPLSEEEVEDLVAELVDIEKKSAEAQEALEDESLVEVEAEVREELSQSLSGDELENAVVDEMSTYKEEWESKLDELEKENAYLLEQLDGAGIDLSSLYKWIEKEVLNSCRTEAWRGRTHWVGTEITDEAIISVSQAEEYLKTHRPMRIWLGASGFLEKKIAKCGNSEAIDESMDKGWKVFSKFCSEAASNPSMKDNEFGSKHWASIYLANTPLQAAELGLKSAGVDEVEEIGDVDGASSDLFVADAIANERNISLTEEQKRNFKKIKKEDDAKDDVKIRTLMKQIRISKHNREGELSSIDYESQMDVVTIHDNSSTEFVHEHQDTHLASKSVVTIFSSPESSSHTDANVNKRCNLIKSEDFTILSSDSGSDVDANLNSRCNLVTPRIFVILIFLN